MAKSLLTKIESELPEFLTSKQLVELGLWPRADAVQLARLRGLSPDYVKIGRKVLYPKAAVLEFIRKHMQKGDVPSHSEACK